MTTIQRFNSMYPFNGLGALGAAAELEQSILSKGLDELRTWLPTALAAAIATKVVTPEQVKAIYCKLAPAIAMDPQIQAAFSAYAPAGSCGAGSSVPPLQKKTNWLLWGGIAVGVVAAVGAFIYFKRRR